MPAGHGRAEIVVNKHNGDHTMQTRLHSVQTTDAARAFVSHHAPEHLTADSIRLIERTADHLHEEENLPRDDAYNLAAQAVSEHNAGGESAFIDVDLTTAHCVFLRIPSRKKTMVFTIRDLLEMATRRVSR